jgi:hypothetical protein
MPDVLKTPDTPSIAHRRGAYFPVLLNFRVTKTMADALDAHCQARGLRHTEALRLMLAEWMRKVETHGKTDRLKAGQKQ